MRRAQAPEARAVALAARPRPTKTFRLGPFAVCERISLPSATWRATVCAPLHAERLCERQVVDARRRQRLPPLVRAKRSGFSRRRTAAYVGPFCRAISALPQTSCLAESARWTPARVARRRPGCGHGAAGGRASRGAKRRRVTAAITTDAGEDERTEKALWRTAELSLSPESSVRGAPPNALAAWLRRGGRCLQCPRVPTSVVTGGAGFLGSHLCEYLLERGHRVICVDNLVTSTLANIEHMRGDEFLFLNHDVTEELEVDEPVDFVYHFAALASPVDYMRMPLHSLKVGSYGTHHALGLAKFKRARFLLASTSEVYGDPQVHPQPETYWGHVNPIGPRGVYDEAKRYAEALTMAYHNQQGLDTAIVRIFNTYGPRMRAARRPRDPELHPAGARERAD